MKRTSEWTKRMLAMFLAVVLTISALVIASPIEVEAASTPITDSVIKARIDELNNKLGGTYFNTTHQCSTCGKKYSGHGCDYCSNARVIKQAWFKNLFKFSSTLSTSQFPKTYTTTGYVYPTAKSCAGFASFAEWYIFRTSDSSSVSTKKIGDYKSNKSNWSKYAQMGDLIRWNGHSFIYISCDNSGVKVLDSNWGGTYNCKVQIHTIKYGWSSAKFTISRESTRATFKHTCGYKTEWNGSKYINTVCKKCGKAFNFSVDTKNPGYATTVEVSKVYAEPYKDSLVLYTVLSKKQVKILGKTTNAYGNVWYKVSYTYNGKTYTGYMYRSSLTAFICK